jgi:hypothetical protein
LTPLKNRQTYSWLAVEIADVQHDRLECSRRYWLGDTDLDFDDSGSRARLARRQHFRRLSADVHFDGYASVVARSIESHKRSTRSGVLG